MDKFEIELAGTLRRLLRLRYVLRTRNEKWFTLIIEHRKRILEIVSSFGAELEINEPLGLAYLRASSEEIEDKIGLRLSRRQILGPFASALILQLRWLRMQFFLQPTGHDVPIVGAADLREFLEPFSRSSIDNQFEKMFRRSLEELVDIQVIIETEEGSGFYEITPLCELLVPADQIHELRARADIYFSRFKGVVDAR